MKNFIVLLVGVLLIMSCSTGSKQMATKIATHKDTISVVCSPDMYKLTANLANEFCSTNPGLTVNVVNFTDADANNILNSGSTLCLVSSEFYSSLNNKNLWKITLGRDALVPIMNVENPLLEQISKQGIRSTELAQMLQNPEKLNWTNLLKNGLDKSVNYYFIENESVQNGVAKFLNVKSMVNTGIKVKDTEELIAAIQKDPLAVGFCELVNVIDKESFIANISLLPIDKNENGQLDYVEKIYDTPESIMRGIWIGKFPRALNRNIYTVSIEKPTDETETAFLGWILTNGQGILNANGFLNLNKTEIQSELEILNFATIANASVGAFAFTTLFLVLLAIALIIAAILVVVWYIQQKRTTETAAIPAVSTVFNENSVGVLNGLFYDKSHTWAYMEKDGLVRVGIDDFLQHAIGKITKIKMKNPGEKVKKGEHILAINQQGKQLNIAAPVSGTIRTQNERLETNSTKVNTSPYTDGWIYLIEPANWLRETQFLLAAEKYKEWIKSEFTRLKDFLAVSLSITKMQYAPVILQDGGELKDNILEELGPEIWEEFQTRFIDTSL